MLTLEWPETIRVGDSDVIRLSLEVDDRGGVTPTAEIAGHEVRGEVVEIPDAFETHNVLAEARFDITGLEVAPQGVISEPLHRAKGVTFFWSVRAAQDGSYTGAISLHLRFIPKDPANQEARLEERIPISAQRVEIRAVNFLGLGGPPARILGGIGTLIGSMLSLESLLPWFWKRVRRGASTKRPAGKQA
jgi:hypothetical protein